MEDMHNLEIKVKNEVVQVLEKKSSLSLKRRRKKKRIYTEEERKFILQLIVPFK